MQLKRPSPRPVLITLVPMIDVLMIMLVFFMVTSTYLDLNMIPAADSAEEPAPQTAAAATDGAPPLLIRLAPDGAAVIRGRPVPPEELAALIGARLAEDPLAEVVILPSPRAPVQGLVSLMDTATGAGVERLRVIRLEGEP